MSTGDQVDLRVRLDETVEAFVHRRPAPKDIVIEETDPATDELREWSVGDHIAHTMSRGKVGRPAPETKTAQYVARAFPAMLARRIAEVYLADVNEAAETIAAELRATADETPPHVGRFIQWLHDRYGDDEADWLADSLQGRLLSAFLVIALEAEKATTRQAEAKVEQLERELADTLRHLPARLESIGDRITFPQSLIHSGYHRGGGFAAHLDKINQGELFAPDGTHQLLREASEAVVESTQLGQLPPAQVRAMLAIFHLFSTSGDNGQQFRLGTVRVPARLLYQAAGISPRNGRACRDIFSALDALSNRQLYVALKMRRPKEGGEEGEEESYVVGEKTPIFTWRPIWTDTTDGRKRRTDEIDEIMQQWAARGTNAAGGWSGHLPDVYELALPSIMAKVWGSLVISGDVLALLDRGAKAIRGPNKSFFAIDWRLFIEITQRTQTQHLSEDGDRVRSYVDRDALIRDVYQLSEEDVVRYRRRGKYQEKYGSQFEQAARIIQESGIARWIPGHRGRRGNEQDVFEVDPGVIHGLQQKVQDATARRLQRENKRRNPRPKSR